MLFEKLQYTFKELRSLRSLLLLPVASSAPFALRCVSVSQPTTNACAPHSAVAPAVAAVGPLNAPYWRAVGAGSLASGLTPQGC